MGHLNLKGRKREQKSAIDFCRGVSRSLLNSKADQKKFARAATG
jgi:hypothetical protein